jgi:hypothetical protein
MFEQKSFWSLLPLAQLPSKISQIVNKQSLKKPSPNKHSDCPNLRQSTRPQLHLPCIVKTLPTQLCLGLSLALSLQACLLDDPSETSHSQPKQAKPLEMAEVQSLPWLSFDTPTEQQRSLSYSKGYRIQWHLNSPQEISPWWTSLSPQVCRFSQADSLVWVQGGLCRIQAQNPHRQQIFQFIVQP